MGKKKDFIPKTDATLVVHHNNLKTQVAALVGQIGITMTDSTNLAADNVLLNADINAVEAADAVKKSKVQTKIATVKAVVGRERAFANRVKAAVGYTPAIGQQLGIIGEEDSTDLSNAAPTLTGTIITLSTGTHGVEVGFDKSISDGVQISCKRGNEVDFTLLATDGFSPYIDNRPNLGPGPETRHYQAVYLQNDHPIGHPSAILNITVPGTTPPPLGPPPPPPSPPTP